MTTHS